MASQCQTKQKLYEIIIDQSEISLPLILNGITDVVYFDLTSKVESPINKFFDQINNKICEQIKW